MKLSEKNKYSHERKKIPNFCINKPHMTRAVYISKERGEES
jgi:hypothetical protein